MLMEHSTNRRGRNYPCKQTRTQTDKIMCPTMHRLYKLVPHISLYLKSASTDVAVVGVSRNGCGHQSEQANFVVSTPSHSRGRKKKS